MQVEHAILLKIFEQILDLKPCYRLMAWWCSPQRLLPAIQSPAIHHNRLLINMTVQYVQQIRQRLEWNLENETAKATQHKLPTLAYPASRAIEGAAQLAPTRASIQFLLLFFVYTSSWPACNFSIVVSQYSLNKLLVDQS